MASKRREKWVNLFSACGSRLISFCYLQIVQQTHVNLVDLVDTPTTHRRIRLFSSVEELSEYSLRTRKIFPKENAKAGGLLRFLLRHIMNPEQDDASKLRGGGGKSGRSRRNF